MSKESYVENIILDEILSEKLKPGELMAPERDLAIKYGCSRPVIHKAIIRLEQKGVLKIRPRKGIQVLDYRIHGRLGLISEISSRSKDLINNQFNHDMLSFVTKNIENIFTYFSVIEKKATTIKFDSAEDYFHILFDYSLQCGNSMYILLMNEFKQGIINVASYCINNNNINNYFISIEEYLMIKESEKAIEVLEEMFEAIEKVWLGGDNV